MDQDRCLPGREPGPHDPCRLQVTNKLAPSGYTAELNHLDSVAFRPENLSKENKSVSRKSRRGTQECMRHSLRTWELNPPAFACSTTRSVVRERWLFGVGCDQGNKQTGRLMGVICRSRLFPFVKPIYVVTLNTISWRVETTKAFIRGSVADCGTSPLVGRCADPGVTHIRSISRGPKVCECANRLRTIRIDAPAGPLAGILGSDRLWPTFPHHHESQFARRSRWSTLVGGRSSIPSTALKHLFGVYLAYYDNAVFLPTRLVVRRTRYGWFAHAKTPTLDDTRDRVGSMLCIHCAFNWHSDLAPCR